MIDLPRGSKITPVSRMHGGGGSQTINLTVNAPHYFAGGSQELARHLVGELERFAGAGGKIRISRAIN